MKHQGTQLNGIRVTRRGDAKLNIAHNRQGTIKIKQEVANTETGTKTCGLIY